MSNDEYTLEELLISRMAHEFHGNAMGVGATFLADLAARLAKALYVPDLFLTTVSRAAADCDVHAKSLLDEWKMAQTARCSLDWPQMFHLIAQGKLQIWMGAVQIDRHGNSNISVVGPWDKPKAQLVGARGVPDDLWGCARLCYHIRRHTPRSFVEEVDFVCARGYDDEAALRTVKQAAPGIVVSDLGVFAFDDNIRSMKVVSLHPGVEFDELKERTGFEWPAPTAPIPITPPPTAAELRCIRETIDPLGLRKMESTQVNEQLMIELWQREVADYNH